MQQNGEHDLGLIFFGRGVVSSDSAGGQKTDTGTHENYIPYTKLVFGVP
jgi:hypothetical protein